MTRKTAAKETNHGPPHLGKIKLLLKKHFCSQNMVTLLHRSWYKKDALFYCQMTVSSYSPPLSTSIVKQPGYYACYSFRLKQKKITSYTL